MKYKKGLSSVVAVSAIILSSMLLATSLGIVLKSATLTSLAPALDCTTARLTSPLVLESACYDVSNRRIQARITRSFSDDSTSIVRFDAHGGNNSLSWECGGLCNSCSILTAGSSRIYSLPLNGSESVPTDLAISVNGCALEVKKITTC